MLKNLEKHLKKRGWLEEKIGKLTSSMLEDFLDELAKSRANKPCHNYSTPIHRTTK